MTIAVIVTAGHVYFLLHKRDEKKVSFNMAIGNEELIHECFQKHCVWGLQE